MQKLNENVVVCLAVSDSYLGDKYVYEEIDFEKGLSRLKNNIKKCGYPFLGWENKWPEDCPTMHQCPYGFKSYCIEQAWEKGYRYVVWADSSAEIPQLFLDYCFQQIKKDGYFFMGVKRKRYYGTDYTARKLGSTKEQLTKMKIGVVGGLFGLDRENPTAQKFFQELKELRKEGFTFRGTDKEPFDLRKSYMTHRHDQTVMYLLIKKHGMKMNTVYPHIKFDHKFTKGNKK